MREGLSLEDANRRMEIFGLNKLEEKEGKPPDCQDFVGTITLPVLNSTISFLEENIAGNVGAALMDCLSPKAKVLRDGHWNKEDATVITGSSFRSNWGIPSRDKRPWGWCILRFYVKQGEIDALVIASGVYTFFCKASHLVDST
ncbi:hypothetical protein Pfo_018278 [Paulownia fortunei]|nr:hypothetical protein Pfo_018278 [Paulownia fortunei]